MIYSAPVADWDKLRAVKEQMEAVKLFMQMLDSYVTTGEIQDMQASTNQGGVQED